MKMAHLFQRWWPSAVALILLACATQANAGKLECMFTCEIDSFGSSIKWTSTDCHKPYTPSFLIMDSESFNRAVDQFNAYVTDVQMYLNCLVREVNRDLAELPEIVSKGVERAKREASNEVDNVRSNLEFNRRLLH